MVAVSVSFPYCSENIKVAKDYRVVETDDEFGRHTRGYRVIYAYGDARI